jgi:hypothetical protein
MLALTVEARQHNEALVDESFRKKGLHSRRSHAAGVPAAWCANLRTESSYSRLGSVLLMERRLMRRRHCNLSQDLMRIKAIPNVARR